MTLDDVYLILPEISMTVLAILVVILDLFITKSFTESCTIFPPFFMKSSNNFIENL